MDQAAPALVQYGALGVMVIFATLAVRILFVQVQADKVRETARADRLEQEVRDQNKVMQEKLIPAALELVATTKALIDLMAQQRAEVRRDRQL